MAKQQTVKPMDNNLISTSLFVIYILVITGSLAAGIFSITNSIPEKVLESNNPTNTTTNNRIFDQATVNNVNNLTGSAAGVSSGRSNPFSSN